MEKSLISSSIFLALPASEEKKKEMKDEKISFSGKFEEKSIVNAPNEAYILNTESIKDKFQEHSLSNDRFDKYFTLSKGCKN